MHNFEKNEKPFQYSDLQNFYQASTKYLNKQQKLSLKYSAFPSFGNLKNSDLYPNKMMISDTQRNPIFPSVLKKNFGGSTNRFGDLQLIELGKRLQNLNFNGYKNIPKSKNESRLTTIRNLTIETNNQKKLSKSFESTIDLPQFNKINSLQDNNPIHPCSALRKHRSQLTSLEQEEILNYSDIWYLGLNASKTEAIRDVSPNNGYDDENGAYKKVSHDHIAYRYEILETLGRGSFGQVFKALDHKSGHHVAVKVIRNKTKFHQQSLVEVYLLNYLKEKEKTSKFPFHVIQLLDNFVFRNHPCLVFELLGENLYDVIRRKTFSGFSVSTIQKITHSILSCLSILKKENIIHCDLKPENVLFVNNDCHDIKVIDFGSSCFGNKRIYTYIQSRFYRSPEIILGIPYSTQIDMWSLGCMLPELLTRKPIFPGETETDQLACIMEVLGLPPKSLMDKSTRGKLFFNSKGDPKILSNSRGRKRIPNSKSLLSTMKMNLDVKLIDLIQNCLAWDPQDRFQPDQALRHPWFDEIRRNEESRSSHFPKRLKHQMALKENFNQEKTQFTDDFISHKVEFPFLQR